MCYICAKVNSIVIYTGNWYTELYADLCKTFQWINGSIVYRCMVYELSSTTKNSKVSGSLVNSFNSNED